MSPREKRRRVESEESEQREQSVETQEAEYDLGAEQDEQQKQQSVDLADDQETEVPAPAEEGQTGPEKADDEAFAAALEEEERHYRAFAEDYFDGTSRFVCNLFAH